METRGRPTPGDSPGLHALRRFRVSAWKASVGEYHEAAQPLYLEPTFGNPDLGLQGAIQSSLGIEQHFTDSLHVELTGFYNRRYDLAQSVNEVITAPNGTITRIRLDNEGLGRAYGLMLLLKQEITKNFFGWLAYTLSWSEQKSPGQPDYVPTEFDQRHNLIAVAQYKFGNGWELGGKFQLTTGEPTTIPIGATLSTDTGTYSPIEGPTGGAQPPPSRSSTSASTATSTSTAGCWASTSTCSTSTTPPTKRR